LGQLQLRLLLLLLLDVASWRAAMLLLLPMPRRLGHAAV
jgi:hypothetical protein